MAYYFELCKFVLRLYPYLTSVSITVSISISFHLHTILTLISKRGSDLVFSV